MVLEAMGLNLVDPMGKCISLGSEVYSRKKNWNWELENLKCSINYEGRLRRGFWVEVSSLS